MLLEKLCEMYESGKISYIVSKYIIKKLKKEGISVEGL